MIINSIPRAFAATLALGIASIAAVTPAHAVDGRTVARRCIERDDCTITIGPDSTTLLAELPDQCAMSGLIQRIIDLQLEITRVLLLPRHDAGQGSKAAADAERQQERPWSST